MAKYERCDPEHRISQNELGDIVRLYPYEAIYYRDIGNITLDYLQITLPGVSEYTRIIAQTQHNGRGTQWGILLVQYPVEHDWRLFGQFGHGLSFDARLESVCPYLRFIKYGFSGAVHRIDEYGRPAMLTLTQMRQRYATIMTG